MNRKFFPFIFVLLVAGPLSMVISFVTTIIRLGFTSDFLAHWLPAWGLGFVLAYPTALVLVPMARKIMGRMPWKD